MTWPLTQGCSPELLPASPALPPELAPESLVPPLVELVPDIPPELPDSLDPPEPLEPEEPLEAPELPEPPELPELPEDAVPVPGVVPPEEVEPPSVDADPQPRATIGAAISIAAATQPCRFIESNLPAAGAQGAPLRPEYAASFALGVGSRRQANRPATPSTAKFRSAAASLRARAGVVLWASIGPGALGAAP